MSETPTGSTVPRRQLGRHLRDLRHRARLTTRLSAQKLEWSEAKLWRIETGQTAMRSHDVETVCKVYGAPADITEALKGLARETKSRGWWHAYGDVIPEWLDVYIGLEEAAASLSEYGAEAVPGLLQTPDYARTLIRAGKPDVPDEEIERRVHVRMARQALLTRITAPVKYELVLNEAVLRRPVGGRALMAVQLRRLAELAELPTISLRVMPFSAGLHHGIMSGPFVILRFPLNGDGKESEPPVVYVEGFTGALYLDKPREIDRYRATFASIWDSSLDEPATKDLVLHVIQELEK